MELSGHDHTSLNAVIEVLDAERSNLDLNPALRLLWRRMHLEMCCLADAQVAAAWGR